MGKKLACRMSVLCYKLPLTSMLTPNFTKESLVREYHHVSSQPKESSPLVGFSSTPEFIALCLCDRNMFCNSTHFKVW